MISKMLINICLISFYFKCTLCWSYNVKCLFNDCEEDNSNVPTDSSLTTSNYNPYCLVFGCDEEKETQSTETVTPSSWNPSCWFKECSQNEEDSQKEYPKVWSYNYWFNEENNSKSWKNKFYCMFKECTDTEKVKEEKVESRFSFQGMYNSAIDYLNAAKPQEFIVNNVFTSELNPYCWFTECCNDNTLPVNIEKLSELLNTRLFGQHLASIISEAIKSHWSSKQISKKALVLSFHRPIGTGKNYVTEMIANSLFKLGVKSKYVHYFSGTLHFTSESSDTYKQNLYSWLKGNVTSCSKQLFIFDDADYMPEQVLNSILPMLDYREKVDGADYRNSIFIFLSHIGSEQILNKLDDMYSQNKTREEMQIEDFERMIMKDIFNKKGGFYHSDTISHNLIDHYIPFLPLERKHIIESIVDQFHERNIEFPSEEHIRNILDSISWGQAENFEYALSGCKGIQSKIVLYAKYYTPDEIEKSDL